MQIENHWSYADSIWKRNHVSVRLTVDLFHSHRGFSPVLCDDDKNLEPF
jgi:hypothetical protein